MRAPWRTVAPIALLVAALGVALSWWRAPQAVRPSDTALGEAESARTSPATEARDDASGAGSIVGLPPAAGGPAAADADPFGEEHNGWASVDLEAVRKALPDNVYWTMSAPTQDPDVLRRRAEERERWNAEYGKILSNTATEEEIAAYYGERDRIYSDYVAFATYVLENHGRDLSLRDVGLLKVAVELNLARLEEIPRQMEEARERSKAHAAAREAWLRDQAEFAGANGPAGP